jgi:hypothetical protein
VLGPVVLAFVIGPPLGLAVVDILGLDALALLAVRKFAGAYNRRHGAVIGVIHRTVLVVELVKAVSEPGLSADELIQRARAHAARSTSENHDASRYVLTFQHRQTD